MAQPTTSGPVAAAARAGVDSLFAAFAGLARDYTFELKDEESDVLSFVYSAALGRKVAVPLFDEGDARPSFRPIANPVVDSEDNVLDVDGNVALRPASAITDPESTDALDVYDAAGYPVWRIRRASDGDLDWGGHPEALRDEHVFIDVAFTIERTLSGDAAPSPLNFDAADRRLGVAESNASAAGGTHLVLGTFVSAADARRLSIRLRGRTPSEADADPSFASAPASLLGAASVRIASGPIDFDPPPPTETLSLLDAAVAAVPGSDVFFFAFSAAWRAPADDALRAFRSGLGAVGGSAFELVIDAPADYNPPLRSPAVEIGARRDSFKGIPLEIRGGRTDEGLSEGGNLKLAVKEASLPSGLPEGTVVRDETDLKTYAVASSSIDPTRTLREIVLVERSR